jgi:hypothetical protein
MNLNCSIRKIEDEKTFISYWSSKYNYPGEDIYRSNIGIKTNEAIKALFLWKNGRTPSLLKEISISKNYPAIYSGNIEERYLNPKDNGGPIWNIFYLHCQAPSRWPIFDQHTYRAMNYMKNGSIEEIVNTKDFIYMKYKNEYIPFFFSFRSFERRKVDKALFTFGKYLKMIKDFV